MTAFGRAGAGDDRRGRPGFTSRTFAKQVRHVCAPFRRVIAGMGTSAGGIKSRRVIVTYNQRRRVRAQNAATPRRSSVPHLPPAASGWPGCWRTPRTPVRGEEGLSTCEGPSRTTTRRARSFETAFQPSGFNASSGRTGAGLILSEGVGKPVLRVPRTSSDGHLDFARRVSRLRSTRTGGGMVVAPQPRSS